jgi:hypothetical protein
MNFIGCDKNCHQIQKSIAYWVFTILCLFYISDSLKKKFNEKVNILCEKIEEIGKNVDVMSW